MVVLLETPCERIAAAPKAEHAVEEWPMAGGLLLNADWSSLAGIYVEVKDTKGTQEMVLYTQRRVARLRECGCVGTGMRAEMRSCPLSE